MLAAMPPPIFSFDASSPLTPQYSRPSPFSSSPARASPLSSPPPQVLGSRDPNCMTFFRETQSSPIKPQAIKFKYANRTARPNPVLKRREDAQEGRRRLFMQNVRQRQEDEKWVKRGGGDELLKLEWTRLNRELRQAKDSDIEGIIREEDLEDEPQMEDLDSMMLDEIEQQEQAEIEAMLAALPTQPTISPRHDNQAKFVQFSDDDDYDALFMELASSGQNGDDVEMS